MPHRELQRRVELVYGPARLIEVEAVRDDDRLICIFEVKNLAGARSLVRVCRERDGISIDRCPPRVSKGARPVSNSPEGTAEARGS